MGLFSSDTPNVIQGHISSHGTWDEGDTEHSKKAAGLLKIVVQIQ
jgi:hypothetical protein